ESVLRGARPVAGAGGGRVGAGPARRHVRHRRRQPPRATRRQPGRRGVGTLSRGTGGLQPRLVQPAAAGPAGGVGSEVGKPTGRAPWAKSPALGPRGATRGLSSSLLPPHRFSVAGPAPLVLS